MRGLHILVLLVLVLPNAQPGPSSSVEMGEEVGIGAFSAQRSVLLTEVCPGRPVEYIVLTSIAGQVPLGGMMIDDGEGTITILSNITLEEGDSLALTTVEDMFSSLHPCMPFLAKGSESLRWGGKFALADGGDEVILRWSDGTVADVVTYGTSMYSGTGWDGPPVRSVPKGDAMLRGGGDTNTSVDWFVGPPGRSELEEMTFEAVAEPFSVPETAAGRLVRELSMASRTVNCSVYEISDPYIVQQLIWCASRGLDVNVLIEGQPVGGLSGRSLDAIATLATAGVDVREMRSVDSYKRYDYLHAKYMVIDHRRVTVMSENWGAGLYANRGWGVTMDGVDVGAYYERVFAADFDGRIDVSSPKKMGEPMDPASDPELVDEMVRYRCEVTPLISPDHSASSLRSLIDGAHNVILVEQMYVEPGWLDGPSLLTSLIGAAERGVTVRLLMDSSWDRDKNRAVADRLNDIAGREGYDLEARVISSHHDLSVMHNKGMIVDDLVIVSSINWGNNALYENREAGVAVRSERIASYFSALFYKDWAVDPIPPVVVLPWTYMEIPEGQPVLLDAGGSSDNASPITFEWDVDGDGSVDSNATSWAVKLPPGNHTIVLTVRDLGNNTVTAICWVIVLPAESKPSSTTSAALLVIPVVFVGVVMAWKRINGMKKH